MAGEAAGIALGLLCCGSGGERVAGEALAYAHDTQHEKIIRGASHAGEDAAAGHVILGRSGRSLVACLFARQGLSCWLFS